MISASETIPGIIFTTDVLAISAGSLTITASSPTIQVAVTNSGLITAGTSATPALLGGGGLSGTIGGGTVSLLAPTHSPAAKLSISAVAPC